MTGYDTTTPMENNIARNKIKVQTFFYLLFLHRFYFTHSFLRFFIHFHFNIVVHHHIHINGDAFLWCVQLNGRCASRECKHNRKNKKVRLKFKVFYHLSCLIAYKVYIADFVQIASHSQSYSTIQTYFLGAYNLTLSDYWFAWLD